MHPVLKKWLICLALCIPCVWVYFHFVWFKYLEWLGHVPLGDTSTWIYLGAVILHLVVTPFKEGELKICNFDTGIRIIPGTWFIPNIGHGTIFLFNWAICRMVVPGQEDEEPRSLIRFIFSPGDAIHQIHTEAGLATVAVWRAIGSTLRFIVGYRKGAPHEIVSRFMFRVMVVAFALAWWNNNPDVYVESVRPVIKIPYIGWSFAL